MLVDAYHAANAKAWLFGINTRLDDRAPIHVLGLGDRSDDFAAAVRAARQYAHRVSDAPDLGRVWRVGLETDPLAFVPVEQRSWGNRFDDRWQRCDTLYGVVLPETALREVLADRAPAPSRSLATSRRSDREARGEVRRHR